jgi:hypothetical protein
MLTFFTAFSLCGLSFPALVEIGGIQWADLWEEEEEERSLWTAKLFPILRYDTHQGDGSEALYLNEKRIQSSEAISLCCWFMRENSSIHSPISTGLWKSSPRLSLKDILRCGDGMEMLKERLYLAELCRNSTLSLSSPLWRIRNWSSAYRHVTRLMNLMTELLFCSPSPLLLLLLSLVLLLSLLLLPNQQMIIFFLALCSWDSLSSGSVSDLQTSLTRNLISCSLSSQRFFQSNPKSCYVTLMNFGII